MKTCMVVYSYYPWDPRVRKDAEALVKNKIEVDVICLKNKNEKTFEKINGVNIYRLNFETKRGSKLRYLYQYTAFNIISFFKLNNLDKKRNYDIIHIHSLPDWLVFVAFIQKLKGKKIILDLHESLPEIFLARFNNKIIAKFLTFIEKISANYANEVITVSETLKKMFIQRGVRKNITVIMNVPDENLSAIKFTRTANLKNRFILNYSGSLNKERGLDIAIKAINEIKDSIPSIYLMIFGSGAEEKNLKELVKELKLENYVYFAGMVSNKDVMKYTKIADVGIIPWRSNPITEVGMPNKLFESIALEKPIICGNTKAIHDLMGESILFFEPGNYKDMAKQILFAYQNKNKLKIMVKNASKIYKNISWKIMERRLFDLYEKNM